MKTMSFPCFCSSGTYWNLALGPTVTLSRGGQWSKFEEAEATEIEVANTTKRETVQKKFSEIYIEESCGSLFP